MSTTPKPYYVAEILDVVIDHLSDDKQAIAACSLVCKAWLPPSRYHLFFAVHIIDTGNLTRFLDLLDSPLSTITPFVRSMTLRECDYLTPVSRKFWALDDICNPVTPSTPAVDHRTASLSRFKRLRKLKLSYFHFNHFDELVDLICAFDCLTEISLDFVHWGDNASTPAFRSPPPRSLRAIHLGDVDKKRIFTWMLSAGSSLASLVKVLNLRHINPNQMPALRQFLRIVGPSLEQLHLSFFNFDWTRRSPETLASEMMHTCNLRSIEIEAYAYTSPRLEVWLSLLSQISSDRLESVVFNIWSWTSFNKNTWANMDSLLASPRFSHLRVVCVRLLFLGGSHNAGRWLCERLPRCAARGILTLGATIC